MKHTQRSSNRKKSHFILLKRPSPSSSVIPKFLQSDRIINTGTLLVWVVTKAFFCNNVFCCVFFFWRCLLGIYIFLGFIIEQNEVSGMKTPRIASRATVPTTKIDNDCNKVKTCRPRIHLWDSGCNRRYSEELLTETFHEVKGNVSSDIHSSIYVRLAVFQRWERGVHGVERNYSPWHLEVVTLEITDRTFWMQFTPEEFGR